MTRGLSTSHQKRSTAQDSSWDPLSACISTREIPPIHDVAQSRPLCDEASQRGLDLLSGSISSLDTRKNTASST
jgi:hypothetical protein